VRTGPRTDRDLHPLDRADLFVEELIIFCRLCPAPNFFIILFFLVLWVFLIFSSSKPKSREIIGEDPLPGSAVVS
jgi:hypothetical protein